MTRKDLAVLQALVELVFGLAGLFFVRETAAQPWMAVSDRGVVTRVEDQPTGAAQNPLRHVPDEVLVRLKPGLPPAAAATALAAVQAVFTRRFQSVEGLYHVKLAPGVALHQAIWALRRDPNVVYAEPNFVIEAFVSPNDPSFSSQWALDNVTTPDADINAVGAWDLTTGSLEVVVAVIDSGVDYTHPDLAANMFQNLADCNVNGIDDDGNGHIDDCYGIDTINGDSDPMDDNDHGTHVAGTIGAVGNNAVGITGVAWNVKILPCKFLDATATGDTAGAIACLDYVATLKDQGVNVVASNNSWGGGLSSQALADAIVAQRERGILFIAAAGNAGRDNDSLLTYPCSYDLANVICVAATDDRDLLASFSNYGRGTVHLGAPGVNILSSTPGNTYSEFSGTSMAAPHVTGAVALLYAQNPTRDWRGVRNLIMAGGEARSSLANTISGRRLDALGSLACADAPLVSRVRPLGSQIQVGIGAAVELSVLNVNCADPAGNVTVTVNPSGEVVTLIDDGLGQDQVAQDGLYTGTWMPSSVGTFDLGFPDGTVVQVQVDPHLKPGFPVKAFAGAGSYHGGPAIHVLVGNIDADSSLEILVTGLAQGPLYAWKADGTPVPGWPVLDPEGAAYPVLGELATSEPGLEVFSGHFGSDLGAHAGSGAPLPGWPRNSANYVATPPTLADIDGDGVDEIFTEEEDWKLHAYRASGALLAGWPATTLVGGQERHTPAIADLDGDGNLEIVTASGSVSPGGVSLLVYDHDGTLVSGFPVSFNGHVDTFPVIGDVDGDGLLEIIVAGRVDGGNGVYVFSANGALKRTMLASGFVPYGTALALADLDGDGIPEIIMQTETAVNVWKGDGTTLSGWPVQFGTDTWLENSGPVIGDVDGDGLPDIVVLALKNSSNVGDILVFRRDGTLHPAFPKRLAGLGGGAVPAIADIDRDGRNDIIVASAFWNGVPGYYDKVWAYDLGDPTPHGPIQWGQFMGGPKHHGLFGVPPTISFFTLAVSRMGSGDGVVASSPSGINCGADCSERYVSGTTVSLTATPSADSAFAGWGGACAGQGNPCTVMMTADQSVTASFSLLFTLSVTRAGAGSGTVTSNPPGINCGSDCSEVYNDGTTVTLTAIPAPGSGFASWSGACAGQGNPCTLAMSANHSVTANFGLLASLTVTREGSGSGTVTSNPPGINCGSDCLESYLMGTTVTLTAISDSGSTFQRWSGACSGRATTCTLTMNESKSVTARFRGH